MATERSMTIIETLEEIDARKIMLPAIQRKYIWEENQITRLLDSVMRDYPIGVFLFWKVKKTAVNERGYPMYDFIKDYHERDNFVNPQISLPFNITEDNKNDSVYAVLDGQQRLTSLYIALMGSLSRKIPKKRRANPDAYPRKELYFNTLSEEVDDDGILYDFKFYQPHEVPGNNWYKVKDILQFKSEGDIVEELLKRGELNKIVTSNLLNLFRIFKVKPLVSYFGIEDDSIDNVLDIFVRVNSGGTVLSKTDLLFSTIVAYWKDARNEIDTFLSEINGIGEHYNFDSDFIMRTCLYLLDKPTVMNVSSFKHESVDEIKANWKNIKNVVKDTVNLLHDLGINSDCIISENAILPILYYRFKQNDKQAFNSDKIREDIRKYLVISQIKKIFGNHSNQTLAILRNKLKNITTFSYEEIKTIKLSDGQDLSCERNDIEEWISDFKKGPYTFLLLSLLYPELKYSQVLFEQDHLHPDIYFKGKRNLKSLILKNGEAMTSDKIADWKEKKDTLPNLHLLSSKANGGRKDTPLEKWVLQGNSVRYLPSNVDLSLENFDEFYNKRKRLLIAALSDILIG